MSGPPGWRRSPLSTAQCCGSVVRDDGREGRDLTLAAVYDSRPFWTPWPSRGFPQACPQPWVALRADSPYSGHTCQRAPLFPEEPLDTRPAIGLTVRRRPWFLLSCFKERNGSFPGQAAAPVGKTCTRAGVSVTAPQALSTGLIYIKAIRGG